MVDLRFLHMMYQQWSDGQTMLTNRWIDFIEFAAKHTHNTKEEIEKELKGTYWFHWPKE